MATDNALHKPVDRHLHTIMRKPSHTSSKGIRFAGMLFLLGLVILFSMLIIVDRYRFFGGSETPWVMAQAVLGFLIVALAGLAVWWAPEP